MRKSRMAGSGKVSEAQRVHSSGEIEVVTVRVPAEIVRRIDLWIGAHDISARERAILALLEIGLTVKDARTADRQRARASTLAGRQIDRMGDPAATIEERATRKTRLTEGPSAFRAVRRDRPKRN